MHNIYRGNHRLTNTHTSLNKWRQLYPYFDPLFYFKKYSEISQLYSRQHVDIYKHFHTVGIHKMHEINNMTVNLYKVFLKYYKRNWTHPEYIGLHKLLHTHKNVNKVRGIIKKHASKLIITDECDDMHELYIDNCDNTIQDYKYDDNTKVVIIYVYYERKNEQKNQTNLAFFIKYGLDKSRWKNMNVTTLLIINGRQCEVLIPKRHDIIVWKRDYKDEYDIGSYRLGIDYLEKRLNKKLYESFEYLFIMNAGISGPIYESNVNTHWLYPFIHKMTDEKSSICSPVINFLRDDDSGGPGPRCQSYCSMIHMTEKVYNLLLHTKISNLAEGTFNIECDQVSDYVLKTHTDKNNIILVGEYGLTRVLLKNGMNISCLLYSNIDYNDKQIWDTLPNKIDRADTYQLDYLYKTIFIKNNWIINKDTRDSAPVFYKETINFMNDQLNYKNIYDTSITTFDYNKLYISENIYIHDEDTVTVKCSNKEESYKLFGYSEECILWPLPKQNTTSVAIYCHYDEDNIVKDYVIQALKTLISVGYDIIFCTTSTSINNVDLPFKIHTFTNHDTEEGPIAAGNDLYMWNSILQTGDVDAYEWVLLVNDSILLPIHGIDNMKHTIDTYRDSTDFWGLYLSNEYEIHLCSCYIEFNRKCIGNLKKFYDLNLPKCKNTYELIRDIECKQTQYLASFDYKYNGVVSYEKLNTTIICPIFHSINIDKYLHDKDVFGIKWKYIGNDIKYEELNNPNLNYLMRYLRTGVIPNIKK